MSTVPVLSASHPEDLADLVDEKLDDRVTTSTMQDFPDDPQFKVSLDPDEHPQHQSLARKWIIVLIIGSASLCATFGSSLVRQLANVLDLSFTLSAVFRRHSLKTV